MGKDIKKIKNIISSRKKQTNCFSFFNEIEEWIENKKADFYLIDSNVFIFFKANGFYKFYFYVDTFEDIKKAKELLNKYQVNKDISLEFTTKNEKNLLEFTEIAQNNDFTFYAKFARLLSGINLLRTEEKEYFELAQNNDKEELLKIMHREFDVITDNIPSEEELQKLIDNKSIAIRHIDDEIIFIQIYEYTKGALYSRITWIKKEYRKPKYTIGFYKAIDEYIKQLNIKDYKKLRSYFWVDTSIKNYRLNLKQGAILDGVTCSIFKYTNDKKD